MRQFVFLFFLFSSSCFAATTVSFEVVARADQDPTLFTQGFEIYNDNFFQSSGLYKKSYLLRFAKHSPGKQSPAKQAPAKPKRLDVPGNVFAEGLTIFRGKLYLLSWQEKQAWQFNPNTFQLEKTFFYSGEGWGLTHDDKNLILSDGSDTLKFLNADNFHTERTLTVTLNGTPVKNLNELEYAKGLIWANQWKTTKVFGINPDNGEVIYSVDLQSLQAEAGVDPADSLANGIAYDEELDLFWVTGKYWQYRYLIKLKID